MKISGFHNATHKGWLKAFIILLCTAYIAGCSTSAATATKPVEEKEPKVKVEAVIKHSMGDPREQIAEVQASARLDVIAESGGVLATLFKKSGQIVQAGEVLAKIQSRNALIEQQKAEIALKRAELSLSATIAESNATRLRLTNSIIKLKDLLKQQVRDGADESEQAETEGNLAEATNQLEQLNGNKSVALQEAEVATSRLVLEQAALAWNDGQIISPADGVLTDVKLVEGMNIQVGSAFGVVQKTDKVKIKALLSESVVKLVGSKKELKYVDSNGNGAVRTAKVVYLSDVPDDLTRMYTLELETNNADRSLKPSARVHVQLTTPEEEMVVAVPSLSILREESATYVFVLNGSKAEKREVQLGRVNGTYQEVLSGISVGEQLVVSGHHELKEGQEVKQ